MVVEYRNLWLTLTLLIQFWSTHFLIFVGKQGCKQTLACVRCPEMKISVKEGSLLRAYYTVSAFVQKKTSARTSATEIFSELHFHCLFKCLAYKLWIFNQRTLSGRQRFYHRITAHRNCNTCIWMERHWITHLWHWRSKTWSQSSCCIKNRDNLMCFLAWYLLLMFMCSSCSHNITTSFPAGRPSGRKPRPSDVSEPWHCC